MQLAKPSPYDCDMRPLKNCNFASAGTRCSTDPRYIPSVQRACRSTCLPKRSRHPLKSGCEVEPRSVRGYRMQMLRAPCAAGVRRRWGADASSDVRCARARLIGGHDLLHRLGFLLKILGGSIIPEATRSRRCGRHLNRARAAPSKRSPEAKRSKQG